jgi:cytochrome d ubiquinol oxidase subunit I
MTLIGATATAIGSIDQDVVPARAQMASTLGFHIILACLGLALPTIVLLAEFLGLRRGDEVSMRLAPALVTGDGCAGSRSAR